MINISIDQIKQHLKTLAQKINPKSVTPDEWEMHIASLFYKMGRNTSVHPQLVSHYVKLLKQYKDEADSYRAKLANSEYTLSTHKRFQEKDVWFWQGDGEDHPESMGAQMIVVIGPEHLKKLVNAPKNLLYRARVAVDAYNHRFPNGGPVDNEMGFLQELVVAVEKAKTE